MKENDRAELTPETAVPEALMVGEIINDLITAITKFLTPAVRDDQHLQQGLVVPLQA
ncbi:unnamed protein product [Dovyalis caffra]|uniref:Uncharacterized protein n=1 Tax=Dovyalis caffra TaxID=77055 RepID=A0AAV1STL5_9ROSI|nr:unnamed protein product [Dovyalis caffra]